MRLSGGRAISSWGHVGAATSLNEVVSTIAAQDEVGFIVDS